MSHPPVTCLCPSFLLLLLIAFSSVPAFLLLSSPFLLLLPHRVITPISHPRADANIRIEPSTLKSNMWLDVIDELCILRVWLGGLV
jgi:hypothetical protein